MKALVVCHKPPLSASDGSAIATSSLLDGLLPSGMDVELIAVETDRHPSTIEPGAQAERARALRYESFHADTRVTPLRALRGLFQECFNVQRFDTAAGHEAIGRRLTDRNHDVVILESLFVVPYLDTVRRHSREAVVVLRTQNIEHHIWRRLAANARWPKSWYLSHLAAQLQRYEQRVFPLVDAIAAISPEDRAVIEAMVPGVPVGLVEVAVSSAHPLPPVTAGAPLCSIASYDWEPNIDGMRWFLDQVWPLVRRDVPDARLDIAGWHSDRFAAEFTRPGVQVHGAVDSASAFLAARGVVIAPVRSGSGVRVKLVEAMLAAKPIVTTSVGALGLTTDPDWPIKIRDDAPGLAAAVTGLLTDPDLANAMGASARAQAEVRFSTEAITHAFVDLVALARTRARAGAGSDLPGPSRRKGR